MRECLVELVEGILFKSDDILWLLLELIQLIVFSPISVYSPLQSGETVPG